LSILSLATVGVGLSTIAVGVGLWLLARLLGLELSLIWACVFGALISPTDPIAVLAAVRQGKLSKTLEAVLQGEALFNDGVGIVVFTALLAIASGSSPVSPGATAGLVAVQAFGGAALGAVAGFAVIEAIRTIDDPVVEVMLSLALATGVYAIAQSLGVSGPIAVVAAGLLIGSPRANIAISAPGRHHLTTFWTVVDEILNAVLFLLVGLEILVAPFDFRLIGISAAAVVLVLATRAAVILPWGVFLQVREKERGANMILAWGGLHGALSLALALGIPRGPTQEVVLSATFAVVIFSIVVQGLSFARVVSWSARPGSAARPLD
jgi:CPA1 family monovalent cation:H+ antiporter